MILFKVDHLQKNYINIKGKSSFNFKDFSYKKTAVVSKKIKQNLLSDYQYGAEKVIVVEHKLYFSIWKQEKQLATSKLDNTQTGLESFVDQRLKELGF